MEAGICPGTRSKDGWKITLDTGLVQTDETFTLIGKPKAVHRELGVTGTDSVITLTNGGW